MHCVAGSSQLPVCAAAREVRRYVGGGARGDPGPGMYARPLHRSGVWEPCGSRAAPEVRRYDEDGARAPRTPVRVPFLGSRAQAQTTYVQTTYVRTCNH